MKRDDALILLNALRKAHRYWIPDMETSKFLEDLDFEIRVGGLKVLTHYESDRLQRIYREAQENAL